MFSAVLRFLQMRLGPIPVWGWLIILELVAWVIKSAETVLGLVVLGLIGYALHSNQKQQPQAGTVPQPQEPLPQTQPPHPPAETASIPADPQPSPQAAGPAPQAQAAAGPAFALHVAPGVEARPPLAFRPLSEASTRIVGQEAGLAVIEQGLRLALEGMTGGRGKPLATFLLLGPSGVGKTETAKSIAEVIYGDANRIARLNCNECVGEGGQWRAFGPPRGYIGSDQGGQITQAIKRFGGRCVILFDELEKGSRELFDGLMTGLDEGWLEDASFGERISIEECVLIMTSNAIREEGAELNEDGLRRAITEFESVDPRLGRIRPFRPEFVGRIGRVLAYRPLERAVYAEIVRQRWQQRHAPRVYQARGLYVLDMTPAAAELVVSKLGQGEFGARAVDRVIEDLMLAGLANANVPQDGFIWLWDYDSATSHLRLIAPADASESVDTAALARLAEALHANKQAR